MFDINDIAKTAFEERHCRALIFPISPLSAPT